MANARATSPTAFYNLYEYDAEKRAALELWADALDSILRGGPSEIDGFHLRVLGLRALGAQSPNLKHIATMTAKRDGNIGNKLHSRSTIWSVRARPNIMPDVSTRISLFLLCCR